VSGVVGVPEPKQLFSQAPNFATLKLNAQAKCCINSPFNLQFNVLVGKYAFNSPKGGRCRPCSNINLCI
jgi:hypothetical protein